jgi:phosphomannomutase/phosphoglucomutase
VRIELQDGSWGLVRASSNKPELVIVAESPTSEETMQGILKSIELELSGYPEVGGYA